MENRLYTDQFQLRFPNGMRELVKQNASENGRSMNAEIIFQLKRIYGANEKSEVTA